MKKKSLLAMIAMVAVTVCASLTCMFAFATGDDSTPAQKPSLQFLHVGMGGQNWTQTNSDLPPKTTNWGSGIGLTFTANIYDLGQTQQKTIQDEVTEVSDGNDDFKTNKDLVQYVAAGAGSHSITTIWYDTQGRLAFVHDNPELDTEKDPISGLPYYKYGDGDRVTVQAGFTFPYNAGGGTDKLVLAHDVTVEYDLAAHDWHEVVPEGGTAQIAAATKDDVKVTVSQGNDGYTMWGFTVSLFGDNARTAAFAEVHDAEYAENSADPAGTAKKFARCDGSGQTDFGKVHAAFERIYAQYIPADGTQRAIRDVFYSDRGVTLFDGNSPAVAEGDKLFLKKGFRDAYYYGNTWMYAGQKYANTNYGAVQPIRVLGENVLMVYSDGTWTAGALAPETVDFAANVKSLNKLYQGQKVQIAYSEDVDEVPEYSSSDPEAVAVSDTGMLTGGTKAGSATITVKFMQKTLTLTVENSTGDPVVQSFSASVKAAYGAVVLYKGDAGNAADVVRQITANVVYDNGFAGDAVTIQASDVDFTGFDPDKVYSENDPSTVQTITVRHGDKSDTVPVHVYAQPEKIGAPNANSVSSWGGAFLVVFPSLVADTTAGTPRVEAADAQALGQADKIVYKKADCSGGDEFELMNATHIYKQQVAFAFEQTSYNLKTVGNTLTLKRGFRIYTQVRGAWIATSELDADFKVVWTGEKWEKFVSEAEEAELGVTTATLAVGSQFRVPYSVKPSGAYALVTLTSSDPETVKISEDGMSLEILKASTEPVTVTVALGANDSNPKTLTVTAVEAEVVGYALYEPRTYHVSSGGAFELFYYKDSDDEALPLMAMEVYDNGSTGVPFALTKDNTVVAEFDNKTEGTRKVTLTIDKDGDGTACKPFDVQADVNVHRSVPQVSAGVMVDPWDEGLAKLYINFAQTFPGKVNVPQSLVDEAGVPSYVTYVRGDLEMEVDARINGEFLVLLPVFDESIPEADRVFKNGDKFVIAKGMPMLEWTGRDNMYAPEGVGQYVVCGTVEYETVYLFTDVKNKMVDTLIEYAGIELAAESIELGLGKLKDAGAVMIPSYATVGEFTVTSADTSVVSVNASGLLRGEKVGTTTVTITLDGGALGPVTKTITVKVVDVASGLKFSAEKVYVKTGTPLTAQVLTEKGVTAQFVWTSGDVSGDVDLSKATFIGFDANKEGEQEVTVRVIKDGTSVTGKLTVVVNESGNAPKKKGCGCGGAAGAAGGTVLLGVTLLCVALLTAAKRRKKA